MFKWNNGVAFPKLVDKAKSGFKSIKVEDITNVIESK